MFPQGIIDQAHIYSGIQLRESSLYFHRELAGIMNELKNAIVETMKSVYETVLPRLSKNYVGKRRKIFKKPRKSEKSAKIFKNFLLIIIWKTLFLHLRQILKK
jgi:hypothetical protein